MIVCIILGNFWEIISEESKRSQLALSLCNSWIKKVRTVFFCASVKFRDYFFYLRESCLKMPKNSFTLELPHFNNDFSIFPKIMISRKLKWDKLIPFAKRMTNLKLFTVNHEWALFCNIEMASWSSDFYTSVSEEIVPTLTNIRISFSLSSISYEISIL